MKDHREMRFQNQLIRIIFVCLILFRTTKCDASNSSNEEILTRLLNALEKAYDFYDSEFHNVNLDGVYGLRVSEGALLKILKEQRTGHLILSKPLLARITTLQKKAANSADKSLPHLKQSSPLYYKKFATTVSKPWENFKPFKRLDHSLYIPANKRSQISFDEDTSDKCMTEMTGTGQQARKPCQLSTQCWSLMTAEGTDGYALTHQALFLLIGEVQGCKKVLQEKLNSTNSGNLELVYGKICASMYPQMLKFEKTKIHQYQYEKDLYMEQAMVCGSMGYSEFLSMERLDKILRWQKRSGCFGDDDDDESKRDRITDRNNKLRKSSTNKLEEELYDDLSRGYDFKIGANSRKLKSMRTMRSLLMEKALSGGCMSHITGVATGLLGIYLRWAVHLMYPQQTKTSRQTKEHLQLSQEHHMFLRKMMENKPLAAERFQKENKSQTLYIFVVITIVIMLWAGLMIKKSRKMSWVDFRLCNNIKSPRFWDKNAIQKRNI